MDASLKVDMGSKPAQPPAQKRLDAAGRIVAWGELALVAIFVVWTLWGMALYLWESGGTLDGLLTMLDTKWKGVLILAALLFLPVIRPLVNRLKISVGPLAADVSLLPPSEYENPPTPPDQPSP